MKVSIKTSTTIRLLAFAIIIAGIGVIIGWIFDYTPLKSILSMWTAMNILTAISFILSGISLALMLRLAEKKSIVVHLFLTVVALILLLTVSSLLFSSISGIYLGFEELLENIIRLSFPGHYYPYMINRPVIGTLVGIFLFSISTILSLGNICSRSLTFRVIGTTLFILGTTAIVGYITFLPILAMDIGSWASPITFNSAILFMLLGLGTFLLGKLIDENS